MVHARANQVKDLAGVCAGAGVGAVYGIEPRGRPTTRQRAAQKAIETHRKLGGVALENVLIDAQRYRGAQRIRGTDPQDLSWTGFQHRLGLPWAMTDSGYIDADDSAALRWTLDDGRKHSGPTVVALPLDVSWLTRRVGELCEEIDKAGLPVALMLGCSDDPLSRVGAINGLIEVLNVPVPVCLLRCDVSAIGALAFGAAVGAVGTSTSLRHIFPPGSRGGPNSGRPAAIVPRALIYKQLDRIQEAIRVVDDVTFWTCNCVVCMGKTIDWIIDDGDAFRHSVAALADLSNHVLDSSDPVGSWMASCKVANHLLGEIAAQGLDWELPAGIRRWSERRD